MHSNDRNRARCEKRGEASRACGSGLMIRLTCELAVPDINLAFMCGSRSFMSSTHNSNNGSIGIDEFAQN